MPVEQIEIKKDRGGVYVSVGAKRSIQLGLPCCPYKYICMTQGYLQHDFGFGYLGFIL